MIVKALSSTKFDNSDIQIPYKDLDTRLAVHNVCCWFWGAAALPSIAALVHPTTLGTIAIIYTTGATIFAIQKTLEIRSRVAEILDPNLACRNLRKHQSQRLKKTISSQLNKVAFSQALSSALAWTTVENAVASYKVGASSAVTVSILVGGLILTGISAQWLRRSHRRLRTSLAKLPPP